MNSSVVVKNITEGTYFDAMANFLRHGDKMPIPAEHKAAVEKVERAKAMWLHYKQDTTCVNMLMAEYKVSRSQAYNYLADAKAIYCLQVSFNYFSELLIEKERLDKLIAKAEKGDNAFSKLIGKLIEQRLELLKLMKDVIESENVEEQKQFTFIYHNDWSKIPGLSAEEYESWQVQFDELEAKARKRYENLEVTNE